MKKILKSRLFFFILGAILFGGIGVVYAYVATASDVSYTPSDSSWSVNNVKSALDGLYTKANTWIDPSYIDMATVSAIYEKVAATYDSPEYSRGAMIASSAGVCIFLNDVMGCFKTNNYAEEKVRLQQYFNANYHGITSPNCADLTSQYRCYVPFGYWVTLYPDGKIRVEYDGSNDLRCEAEPPDPTYSDIGEGKCYQY